MLLSLTLSTVTQLYPINISCPCSQCSHLNVLTPPPDWVRFIDEFRYFKINTVRWKWGWINQPIKKKGQYLYRTHHFCSGVFLPPSPSPLPCWPHRPHHSPWPPSPLSSTMPPAHGLRYPGALWRRRVDSLFDPRLEICRQPITVL